MNFTKIFFLTVLFLSFNNFGMFRASQVLKTLSKTNLKQNLLLQYTQKSFISATNPNIPEDKSFNLLRSEPIKQQVPKIIIPDSVLSNLRGSDTNQVLEFLQYYDFVYNNDNPEKVLKLEDSLHIAIMINLDPEVALALLKYLKEDKPDSRRENFATVRRFFKELKHEQEVNRLIFKNLKPRMQNLILNKFGKEYYKMTGEDFEDFNDYILKLKRKDLINNVGGGLLIILAGAYVLLIGASYFELITETGLDASSLQSFFETKHIKNK